MKQKTYAIVIVCLFAGFAWSQAGKSKPSSPTDWKDVDAAMGRAGQDQPDGTHKFGLPRKDLNVSVNGVQIKAGLALGSWVAFKTTAKGSAMVMGDLVLADDEVVPVMQEVAGRRN